MDFLTIQLLWEQLLVLLVSDRVPRKEIRFPSNFQSHFQSSGSPKLTWLQKKVYQFFLPWESDAGNIVTNIFSCYNKTLRNLMTLVKASDWPISFSKIREHYFHFPWVKYHVIMEVIKKFIIIHFPYLFFSF